jgi:hypothetical protein
MHKLRLAGALFVFAALFNAIAQGQTSRGTVTGIVTDPSGSAIPGAAIDLKGTLTGVSRSTTTNETGVYRFDAVDLGEHDLTVRAKGFRTTENRALNVQAAQTVGLDVRLEIGDNVSAIEVSAEAKQLQTEAPVRGGNISAMQSMNLPFYGRNPAMLAITLPGVVERRQNTAGSATFSVNGARGRSNNFLLDGTENNDISVAGQAFQIKIPEAVQEVSVQTASYDAEFGRAGGAVVNRVIKSGTNNLHGSLGYVVDVTNDDAITNTQSLDPEIQKRGKMLPGTEQYISGTLGGRLIKDKTFFFTSWQEQRQRSTSQISLTTLSAAGKAKLRSLFPVGANPRADTYLNVTNGVTATGQFGTIALGVDPVTGVDRGSIEAGTGLFAYPRKFDDRQTVSKIDHHFSERDILTFRYGYEYGALPLATSNFPGYQTSDLSRYQAVVLAETHVFSPSFTNELRLPYNRFVLDDPLDATAADAQTLPQYVFTPLSPIGIAASFPQGRIANSYVLQDTVSYVRGRHTFRTGVDLLNQRSRQIAPQNVRGNLSFGSATGYSAFANFLDDFSGSNGGASRDFGSPVYYPTYFRQAYFFQDRWQVNPNLTLTLGVRYENHGTPMNSLMTPAFTGLFNVDPRTAAGPYNQPNEVKRDNNNWIPVVGVAYSPSWQGGWLGRIFGDKKSVIRSGFNMGYDSFFNNIASNAAASSPNLIATSNLFATSVAEPRGRANVSTLFPVAARNLTPRDAQNILMSGDLVNPYYMRWSFGIQRELPGGFILDTAYVGSSGVRLYVQQDLNPAVPAELRVLPNGYSSLAQLQSAVSASPNAYTLDARLDPLQGVRIVRTNDGHSSYHSWQTQFQKRFTRNLGLNAVYTWSKMLDNGSELFTYNNTLPTASLPPAFGGQKFEKGLSLYDRTHKVSLAWLYELPFMRTQQGFLGKIAGGWQIAGITSLESGVPYSVANGADSDGIGGANRSDLNPAGQAGVRAQWVGISASNPYGYINPDVFDGATGRYISTPIDPKDARYIGLPAIGTAGPPGYVPHTGNAGRNTERVPGLNNWDVNLSKNVRINERVSTEFRTEFYNIWNHPQYGYRSVGPFVPGEGTIASSVQTSIAGRFVNPQALEAGGRIIRYQLSLRF